jgi:hypothetical protein
MKPGVQSISDRFSSHAKNRSTLFRQLKRNFATMIYDPERYTELSFKRAIGNATMSENREFNVLQKLRRWKCDCSDCELL